jgi:hypothetical protein
MNDHLGIRAGTEDVAASFEFGLEFSVVVDFAVVDDVHGRVLVTDRLAATLDVDDGEATDA